MKVAVYTIAKNEEQFVQRWAASCADADHRYILDTGSVDNTIALAKAAGIATLCKVFDPWRFDTARNHVLNLLPDDANICIALDMDEVLLPGWREALQAHYNPGVDRYRYKYVWSWNADGSEGLVYGGDKIHARHGLAWKHPVHEVLKKTNGAPENQVWVDGLEIHHHPDSTKSRGQYLPLLELAVREDPGDDRNQFYLAREYFFVGNYAKAEEHFKEHLRLSHWAPERAAGCRYLYRATNDPAWLYRALQEDPSRRENYVALAKHFYERANWQACLCMIEAAFACRDKPLDYLCESEAWSWLPYDLGAIACHWLGQRELAIQWGEMAHKLNPGDERLAKNLGFYRDRPAAQTAAGSNDRLHVSLPGSGLVSP